MDVLSFFVATLSLATSYALVAVAAVIIYRSSRVLPFHLGELGVLGAYLFSQWYAQSPWLALLAALATAIGTGLASHVMIDRWGGARGHFVGTVLSIAAAILLSGVIGLIWSGETRRLPLVQGQVDVAGYAVSASALLVILIGGTLLLATAVALRRSRIGIEMSAIADSRRLAQVRKIPVRRVLGQAWVLAGTLAVAAGVLSASRSTVAIEGAFIGVSGIVAAILGGLTSVGGAIVGALLIAGGEHAVTLFLGARYSQVVPILILVLVLLARPTGLGGHVEHISRV